MDISLSGYRRLAAKRRNIYEIDAKSLYLYIVSKRTMKMKMKMIGSLEASR